MECQQCDSKKLFKVFDGSKRKRARKKRDGVDDNSAATDGSTSGCQANVRRVSSAKVSLQELSTDQNVDGPIEMESIKRERDSSPSVARSPTEVHRSSRSPRRHRRHAREGISLALKAGLVSTPRSISPLQDRDVAMQSIPQDQDSFIYAFLEEAIKGDKKKQRHTRRQEERRISHDREVSGAREHRHHHRRRREEMPSRERDKYSKEDSHGPAIDQAMLYHTFAKLFAQMTEKCNINYNAVPRTQSHKSLQCEVQSRHDAYEVDRRPTRIIGHDRSRENVLAPRIRSQEEFRDRIRSHDKIPTSDQKPDKCNCCYNKVPKYESKLNMSGSRIRAVADERYRDYPDNRSYVDQNRTRQEPPYSDYDRKNYEDEKKRYFEQRASRSFEVHREGYPDDDKCRRTARSDCIKEKLYDEKDKRYDKYYYEKNVVRDRFNGPTKDRRIGKNMDRFERNSIASRDDDYRNKDRDRYSERERDSGLSVADGDTSTISGRSNYLRVVKQEIAEQREAMDKMMKLWKELMRCFKGMSQTNQGQDKGIHESAQNVKESAAAQLRLWRECMRRYETVARDVGDTDARLMEEINKQRSEMAEMSTMWQECLQRYRDMSNDFNSLKQKLVTSESPTRMPAAPLICAEGEGSIPAASYRIPPNYPTIPPMAPGYPHGSPLRSRASAPPAWWWCGEGPRVSPRRRSSPDSRGSRERNRDRDKDRRHRHKDREDTRYKDKSSKPSAARSEHRHRKR
ncbi:hypothetical protein K1T71_012129 [Dendrolimus kikuchii]|uniref:Uncharacterized protein n=1 Tax=Dendrolimus kikuchii TaxID=765133 RepID=A0ACC1CKP0_9NEOP|nr:hypothetical protein K1T71_012129 [Dendrolimus kikuchii]